MIYFLTIERVAYVLTFKIPFFKIAFVQLGLCGKAKRLKKNYIYINFSAHATFDSF